MKKYTSLLALAVSLAHIPLSVGCATDTASDEQNVGQIKMALEGTAESGTVYRLIDAVFVISGPTSQVVTPAADATSAVVELPAGNYEIELVDGWSFAEVQEDGTLLPVDATLVSANPQSFSIGDSATTSVQFLFDADEPVILGEGTLDLSIGIVDDVAPSGLLLADFEDGFGNEVPGGWTAFQGEGTQVETQFLTDADSPDNTYGRAIFSIPADGFLAFSLASLLDLSEYSVLKFSYRGSTSFHAQLFTPETVDQVAIPGGTCTSGCWDAFAAPVPESNTWTEIEIPLDQFAQEGWGTPAPAGLTEALLVQFRVQNTPAGLDLDNIRLE